MTNVQESCFGGVLAGLSRAFSEGDPDYLEKSIEGANVAALRSAYTNLLEGRIAEFSEYLSPDVELEIHGLPEWKGRSIGRDEVLEAMKRNFSAVDSQQPKILGLAAQGNKIAVMFSERGTFRASGASYLMYGVQWFTIREGKIVSIEQVIGAAT